MAITLNGVTYNGGANPLGPDSDGGSDLKPMKIGRVLVAASGARSFVWRQSGGSGIIKREWALSWSNANTTTRTALLNLLAVAGTFLFQDEQGAFWTVQIEEEDLKITSSFTRANNTILYNIALTLHQA
jgi:hypothetical protein